MDERVAAYAETGPPNKPRRPRSPPHHHWQLEQNSSLKQRYPSRKTPKRKRSHQRRKNRIFTKYYAGFEENHFMRGLALSGGGFRATLFHLGVINYLYDVESAWNRAPEENQVEGAEKNLACRYALTGIRYMTSVSGGSILAAHLVLNWERYTDFEDRTKFEEAAGELVRFIKYDVRGRIVRRLPYTYPLYFLSVIWRMSPLRKWDPGRWIRHSPTDHLERYYHKRLFNRANLENIEPQDFPGRPSLSILTTDLGREESAASFTNKGFSSSYGLYEDCHLPLARAVAASSAFPGMFPPMLYDPTAEPGPGLKLSDGGVYDNLGVRKFWELIEQQEALEKEGKLDPLKKINQIIVSDASVRFKPSFGLEFLEPLTVPIKASDILFRRVYTFERSAAETFDDEHVGCSFRFLKLRQRFDDADLNDLTLCPAQQKCLYSTRTDLDEFSDLEIAALVRHGYTVARRELAYQLPSLSNPNSPPKWDPVPNTTCDFAKAICDRKASTSTTLYKATRTLERSARRPWRLFKKKTQLAT